MKVGIVTIIDNNNYGNRLQNYALQYFLEKNGISCATLCNSPFTNTKDKFFLRLVKNFFKGNTYSKNISRKKSFLDFNKFINFDNKKLTAYSKDLGYNYYIVGSDQVWNPQIGRLREVDLLDFCDDSKRISYAASFGIEDITYNEKIFNSFSKFKKISVREDAGKKIIQNFVDRDDIEVLIDPTMLLSESDWDRVIKKPKNINNRNFILCYFLGNLSDNRKNVIAKFAMENDCEIINILDVDSEYYECGPSEFLWLEKNALLICTDSFHSSVFSILFNRPFIIFDREQNGLISMNSRIDTLISKFEIENRRFSGEITSLNINHNYEKAFTILENERKKSKSFLESALNVDLGESDE